MAQDNAGECELSAPCRPAQPGFHREACQNGRAAASHHLQGHRVSVVAAIRPDPALPIKRKFPTAGRLPTADIVAMPHPMPPLDAKRYAPAAERNTQPIIAAISKYLPATGRVLEVASGTGQHCVALAAAFPTLTWQPSDLSDDALASIHAYIREAQRDNLMSPVQFDVCNDAPPLESYDVVLCINMIHISPWQATLNLLGHASSLLPVGGRLILYGPYKVDGDWGAQSNAEFDQSLRSRDPSWGVRELRDVESAGAGHGLGLEALIPMPANNHTVVFQKN